MLKPLIGIVSNVENYERGIFIGSEKSYINNDYITSVLDAGGIPMMLPIVNDEEIIKTQVEKMDGILISGGCDINSLLYGEKPIEKPGSINKERDNFEISLIKCAIQLKKPILGICRGLQILNVVFGGTLYQDLSFICNSNINHFQKSRSILEAHTVKITKGSKLYEILSEKIATNSFHHQAVKEIAPGFIVSGISEDNVIEAIEKEGKEFVMGVQWHPEILVAQGNIEMKKLFQEFIKVAIKI